MAAKTNSKTFAVGVMLAISFFAVLALIFSPVFGADKDGKAMNGLTYADDLFNKLSKGSSYFIPKLQKNVQGFAGRPFSAEVSLEKPETAALAANLFTAAGATANAEGGKLSVSGDLGAVLTVVLRDADEMYRNDGQAVAARYGVKEKDALRAWWTSFSAVDKYLKRNGKIEEAKMISDVNKKAIETAYNYYGVEAQNVADKALLMTALLVFYVIYTMWWGFAIFYMFDGIGLTMTKAKVKKEA
jgi:hypothetical protein